MNQTEMYCKLAASFVALKTLLVEKGVVDGKELEDLEVRAMAIMDQQVAKNTEEFLKANPSLATMMKLFRQEVG